MKRVHRSVALLSFAALLATAAHADLVTNGSFESFSGSFGADGGAALVPSSTTLSGWTVTSGDIAVLKNPNIYQLTSFDGNNFLELTGYSNSGFPKGVSQVLSGLTPGQSYSFSMELGIRNGPCVSGGNNCTGPVSVSATIGGTSQTFTHNSSAAGNIWGAYGFDFVAGGATETLTILGLSVPRGGEFLGLDAVSVNAGSVSPVPEPASYALMLAGLVAVAGAVRRRCRMKARV
jgi:hypothetical protein